MIYRKINRDEGKGKSAHIQALGVVTNVIKCVCYKETERVKMSE